MNKSCPPDPSLETGAYPLGSDLHIYYLKGYVRPENEKFNQDFLGNWQEDGFSFLFFARPAGRQIEALLKRQKDLTFLDKFHMSYADWHGGDLMPLSIGSFYIAAPWLPAETQIDPCQKINLILDPGVVFGNGRHPTTADCLKALEQLCGSANVDTVIDLGTGTGLLALAASRLGCRRVLAVDSNYLATQTTRKNIRLNQAHDRILVVQGKAENFMDIPADLMIANLHYDVLKRLIASPGFMAKKYFILSGLLRSQAGDVRYDLDNHPVRILNSWSPDGIWHTFLGTTVANNTLPAI